MACKDKINELYEKTDDIEYVRDVAEEADYFSRLERREADRIARDTKKRGRYATGKNIFDQVDEKRVMGALKGLKSFRIQDIDGYHSELMTVKSIKHVKGDTVAIDTKEKGVITVNTATDTAEAGGYYVTLGSEVDEKLKTTKVEEFVLRNGDELWNTAIDIQARDSKEENFDLEHSEHLLDIVETYADIVAEAGIDGGDITVEYLTDVLDPGANIKGFAKQENVGGKIISNKVEIVRGHKKYNSELEIFAHELQHILLNQFLDDAEQPLYNRELDRDVTRLRKLMMKEITPRDLIADIENPSQNDLDRAEMLYDYINYSKASNSEFLAFATTNKNMINKLKELDVYTPLISKEKITKKPTGVLQKLWYRIAKILNILHKSIKHTSETEGPRVKGDQAAKVLMNKLLELNKLEMEKNKAGVFDSVNEAMKYGDEKLGKYTGRVDKEKEGLVEELQKSLKGKSRYDKIVDRIWRIRLLANAKSAMIQNNFFSSLYNMKDNKDVAKFYEIFRHTKKTVDKTMIDVKNYTRDTLLNGKGFKDMDASVRSALNSVIVNTDIKAIGGLTDIEDMLNNPSKLDEEIEVLSTGLKPKTIEHVNALADMLVTNQMNIANGYYSAESIARHVEEDADRVTVDEIDKLISMIALKNSSEIDKEIVRKAIVDNRDGIEYAIEVMRAREQKLLNEGYIDARWAYAKGSKHEAYEGNISYYIVPREEAKKLEKAKVSTIEKHEELSRIMGEDMMLIAGKTFDVQYSEGAISMIQLKNEGDSLRRILENSGKYTLNGIDEIIENETKRKGSVKEALVPERTFKGDVYDYRLRISNKNKLGYLGLNDDFVETVAHTVANNTHKDDAIMNNRGVVKYLLGFHKKYKDDTNFKFVKVDSRGKYKEYWDRLPYYLKRMVEKDTGEEGFYIEESMLVNTFGYTNVSISNSKMLKNNKAMQIYARKTEKVIQELTSIWKKGVVTIFGPTITGNIQSNFLVTQAYIEDKNPVNLLKKTVEMVGEMEDYMDLQKKKIQLELDVDSGNKNAVKKLDAVIKEMKSNPMHDIMEDGQYTSLLDDIELGMTGEGLLEGKVNELIGKVDKEERREAIYKAVQELYLTDKSKAYQEISKLTRYPDALFRAIIHQDNLKNGMDKRESLDLTAHVFVYYPYLDNRWVQFANDMDPLAFTKYFFRSIPPMVKLAVNKPFTVFSMEGLQELFDVQKAIDTPYDQYYDPITTLQRKLFSPLSNGAGTLAEDLLFPKVLRPFDV